MVQDYKRERSGKEDSWNSVLWIQIQSTYLSLQNTFKKFKKERKRKKRKWKTERKKKEKKTFFRLSEAFLVFEKFLQILGSR